MNKYKHSAIAMSVALLASPAILHAAELEVYGKARVSVNYANNGDDTATNQDSSISVSSNASRIGFKGSEKLTDAMTAVFQYEVEVGMDEGDWKTPSRDSYAGLKTTHGTLLAGRLSTPYKESTARFDPFGDTVGDYNGDTTNVTTGVVRHDTRASNAIAYLSNKMDKLSFGAAYATSIANDELVQSDSDADKYAVSLMGAYEDGPLYLTLAYETIGQAGGDNAEALKLGALFGLDAKNTLGLIVDRVDDGADTSSTLFVNLLHKLSDKNSLYGAIASRGEHANDDGMTYITFGIKHAYTANVEAYALFAHVANDDNAKVGLRNVGAATGENISALSAGININFSTK